MLPVLSRSESSLMQSLRTHGANLGVRTVRTVRRPDDGHTVILLSPHFTRQLQAIAGSIDALHLHVAYCLEEASAEQTCSHGPIKSTLCVSRGSRRSPCTLFGCIFFGSKCRQSRRRHPSPTLATSTCVTTSRREEKEKQCEHPKSFI